MLIIHFKTTILFTYILYIIIHFFKIQLMFTTQFYILSYIFIIIYFYFYITFYILLFKVSTCVLLVFLTLYGINLRFYCAHDLLMNSNATYLVWLRVNVAFLHISALSLSFCPGTEVFYWFKISPWHVRCVQYITECADLWNISPHAVNVSILWSAVIWSNGVHVGGQAVTHACTCHLFLAIVLTKWFTSVQFVQCCVDDRT